jgi:hypothetical protein
MSKLILALGMLILVSPLRADEEIEREGIALLLASVSVNEAQYRQFLEQEALIITADVCLEVDDPSCIASRDEPGKFHDAILSAISKAVPRDRLLQTFAKFYAKRFSRAELTQILTFLRTEVGQKFVRTFSDSELQNLIKSELGGADARVGEYIQSELEIRFPNTKF